MDSIRERLAGVRSAMLEITDVHFDRLNPDRLAMSFVRYWLLLTYRVARALGLPTPLVPGLEPHFHLTHEDTPTRRPAP